MVFVGFPTVVGATGCEKLRLRQTAAICPFL